MVVFTVSECLKDFCEGVHQYCLMPKGERGDTKGGQNSWLPSGADRETESDGQTERDNR